jgi:tyrosyl-tRNA synthetase
VGNVFFERLRERAVEIHVEDHLRSRLEGGDKLRVKLGLDPTAPDLHVGHLVVLDALRSFQDDGHVVVLIVGDYTALIGDPSGRSETRPILSREQIDANAQTYFDQIYLVLDRKRTEVHSNSEWLGAMGAADALRLMGKATLQQVLQREDFAERLKAGTPIGAHEILYPFNQAYDSVAIKADVELGGTDQLYNLLAGREVMPHYGLEPQVVLTTPLLLSWDGAKMSSSVGNNIPLSAAPEEIFGRTMRISDDQLPQWYELVVEQSLPAGDPLEAKLALARFMVARSHGKEAATTAEEHFARVVRRGEAPEDVPELALDGADPVHLPKVIADAGLAGSTSEARRLIGQGAVKLNGQAVTELDLPRQGLAGALLQVGKRRFARLTG